MSATYTYTSDRVRAALELADSLLDVIGDGAAECPFCSYLDDEHDTDWGDGKGCPVLEYEDARCASAKETKPKVRAVLLGPTRLERAESQSKTRSKS